MGIKMLFFEDWLKLIGKILILATIGMQAYILSVESKMRNEVAEYQASKDHYSHMVDILQGRDILGLAKKAADNHAKSLKRVETNWIRKSKKRRDLVKQLGSITFYTHLFFALGTLFYTIGEFLSFRKKRLDTT